MFAELGLKEFGLVTRKIGAASTGGKNGNIHENRLIVIQGTEQAKDLWGKKYLRAPQNLSLVFV